MRHLNKNQDKKSILIVGSQGMLGREVVEVLQQDSWIQTFGGGEIHACDIDEIDITDPQSIAQGFERFTAELLINCAAYTDVDGAEEEIYSQTFTKGTDPDGVMVVNGNFGANEPVRLEMHSDNGADTGVDVPYKAIWRKLE